MQETVLIKSEPYKFKKMTIFCSLIGIVGIIIVSTIVFICDLFHRYNPFISFETFKNAFAYAWERSLLVAMGEEVFTLIIVLAIAIVPVVISVAIYVLLQGYEITVTDKRVYGKTRGRPRIDLPLDSISATAATMFKGISISTSSGKIRFLAIKNVDEIYKIVNELLMERQRAKNTMAEPGAPQNDATVQLQKYKELLDSGVITQEEFDAKKKQLLGL